MSMYLYVKYKDVNSSVLHCFLFLLLVYKSVIYCKMYCKDLDFIFAMYVFPLQILLKRTLSFMIHTQCRDRQLVFNAQSNMVVTSGWNTVCQSTTDLHKSANFTMTWWTSRKSTYHEYFLTAAILRRTRLFTMWRCELIIRGLLLAAQLCE